MEGETHGGSKSNTGSWLADNEDRDQWGEIQAESIRVNLCQSASLPPVFVLCVASVAVA